jgi:nicotinate-nucleotide--dimethylbenzimidazole phosphoribosyltransferase
MDALSAIHARHGVLNFEPDPVPDDLLRQVLEAAIAAPSPANTQPWTFIAVTEPDLARQVAGYLVDTQREYVFKALLGTSDEFTEHLIGLYDRFMQTPCFIVICREQRARLGPDEWQGVMRDWDLCALGAAMVNLMNAATALGLGTRWFGNPMMDPEPLESLLEIPETVEVVAVTPLGFHEESAKERPEQELKTLHEFERGDKYKLAALLKGKLPLRSVLSYNRYTYHE